MFVFPQFLQLSEKISTYTTSLNPEAFSKLAPTRFATVTTILRKNGIEVLPLLCLKFHIFINFSESIEKILFLNVAPLPFF